jgi:hypothetical protein
MVIFVKILYTQGLVMLMVTLHTKFLIPASNFSVVITVKTKTKEKFHTTAMLLQYFIHQRNFHKKLTILRR